MKESILIVDDEEALASLYCELLCEEGYGAQYVKSGEEALALLTRVPPPALILLDFLMPTMSGEEFVAALKRDRPDVYAKSRVVGFSSFTPDVAVLDAFRREVYSVVEKPHDLDKMIQLVKSLLEGKPDPAAT